MRKPAHERQSQSPTLPTHGASTLPPEAFDAFPRVGACEIHLATDFQNMVYEHQEFPAELKAEMYAWVREHATEERKPKDTGK